MGRNIIGLKEDYLMFILTVFRFSVEINLIVIINMVNVTKIFKDK